MSDPKTLEITVDGLVNDVDSIQKDVKRINERLDSFFEEVAESVGKMIVAIVEKRIEEVLMRQKKMEIQAEVDGAKFKKALGKMEEIEKEIGRVAIKCRHVRTFIKGQESEEKKIDVAAAKKKIEEWTGIYQESKKFIEKYKEQLETAEMLFEEEMAKVIPEAMSTLKDFVEDCWNKMKQHEDVILDYEDRKKNQNSEE